MAEPLHDPLEAAWRQVTTDWDNEEAHKAFVGLCLSEGRLPEAGKRYRAVKSEGGHRAKRAEAQIGKLLTLGMTLIQQERTPPPKKRSPMLTFLVVLALASLGLAIAVWLSTS